MAHVLVADDEPVVRQAVVLMLKALGHTFQEAASPREAERLAEAAVAAGRPFDLLVVDHNFAGEDQDGIDLVDNYFDRYERVPAIMLTASKDRDVILEARQAGVNVIVHKPIHSEPFGAAVAKALGESHAHQALETP